MNNKGQLSTEYLVILAVVVIVALIVVTVLGGFIDIGTGAGAQAAKGYWRSADIGILNWKVSSTAGGSEFMVRNNLDYRIEISDVSVDGASVHSTATVLTAGQSKKFTLTGTLCSAAGDQYAMPVKFTYKDVDNDISGLTFTGTKNIEGNCE
ncbi:MAG: hypothetical protein ABIH11_05600 [Candidatus Altiarchaeota archaeon]